MDGEPWTLTSTYAGHTGPEGCLPAFDGRPGLPVTASIRVRRDGDSIELWTEHDHYVGAAVNGAFFATESEDAGNTWQCGASRLRFRYEGSVAGQLSDDGTAMTGREVGRFLLESGDTITRQWDWRATRD